MSLKNAFVVLLVVVCISLMLFLSDSAFAGPTPKIEQNPQIGAPKIDENLTSQDLLTKDIAVLPPAFVPGFEEPFAPTVSEGNPITQSKRLAGNRVVESLSALGCRVITPAETRKRIIETLVTARTDPLAKRVAAFSAYPGSLVASLSGPDWQIENLDFRREATKAVGEYLGVGYLLRSVMVSKKVDDKLELTMFFDLYDTKTAEVVLYVVGRSTRRAGEEIDIAKMACETGLDVALKEVLRQRPAAQAADTEDEGDITEIHEQVFEKEAQEETGSISGVISPPLPDLVVGATASDGRFSRMAKVDENSGEYIIKDLRPDTYSLAFISRGAFVLVGINLEVALSDLNDEVNAQISEVVDSFDRFFETGDIPNLNNLFAEEASKDKSRIINTVRNTESRRISNKKILVQKGDSSKVAIIRRLCLELKGQMNRKDIIGQEIHLKSIEGQWKITKMRTTAYYGPEWREPEPFVHPYIGYILDPNMAKIDVTTGEEEKGHNYTLPPEAVRMSELKFIKLNELKISLVTAPGADTYSRHCMDYLKHIGLACSIYANDYNGFFPPNFEALREGGYILKESFPKLMKCPAQQREHFETLQEKEEFETLREKYPVQEEDVGYVYIGAGKHWETEELAAITIIAYDKRPAHDNGRNVLFMKGHVEWMPEEDFQKRLAEQKEK